jgi:hypothetical protein
MSAFLLKSSLAYAAHREIPRRGAAFVACLCHDDPKIREAFPTHFFSILAGSKRTKGTAISGHIDLYSEEEAT